MLFTPHIFLKTMIVLEQSLISPPVVICLSEVVRAMCSTKTIRAAVHALIFVHANQVNTENRTKQKSYD